MISRSTNIRAALRSKQRGFLLNPYRFGSGGGTDPLYSLVTLLFHMGGANGSTTFTDSGPLNRPYTSNNGAAVSTAQALFGTGSLRLPGSGLDNPIIYLAVSPTYDLIQSKDFTIEFAFRSDETLDSGATYRTFAGSWTPSNDYSWGCDYGGGSLRFFVATSTSNTAFAAELNYPTTFTANTWYRIAVTGDATTLYMFVDGVLVDTAARVAFPDGLGFQCFGQLALGFTTGMLGYMDEIRTTIGTGACRYTADYTVATAEFPNS